jgi:hypothetical protein
MDRGNLKDFNWLMINDGCAERVSSNVKGKQSDFKL